MEQLNLDFTAPIEKRCGGCEQVWPINIYHNNRAAKDGKQNYCPSCRAVANMKKTKVRRERNKESRKEVVYFIHQLGTDWWKIGRAVNKKERVSSLQCGNPRELVVVDNDHGDHRVEYEWHKIFERRRGRGEWFYFGPEEFIIQEATPTTPIVIWEPE